MSAQTFARNAYKVFKKVLTITRNACIIKTVKDTTQMEVTIMKKLTADEFAIKVMATGTEIEYDNGVWMIYAHLTDDGDVKTSHLDARDLMVTTSIELSDEEGEALMNGNLDDVERQAVVEDLYPKYLEALEDME
nr:MAG TPA: hypothetical protein [Caudoviricetes sp.]